jgi:hypothetical protein
MMRKTNNHHTDPKFTCGNNSNFQMDINGFRISIAFGPGCQVSDRGIRFNDDFDAPSNRMIWGSNDAEVLVWDRNGDPIVWDDIGGQVVGHCTPDTVARFIGCLVNCPVGDDPTQALRQINMAQV